MTLKLKKLEIKNRLYQRRHIAPNLVTVGNLFCGFLTIIYASTGRYEKAILAILIALLLDGMDGRVARKLNATSKFGVEFDSFSDLVSFGVGPAILFYYWCFQANADEFGVFVTFIYVLCAASRLARFNIAAENLKSFEGMPSPAAAGMLAASVNLAPQATSNPSLIVIGTILVLSLSALMISKLEFLSLKKAKLSDNTNLILPMLGALIALTWYKPRIGLFAIAAIYCLSGPCNAIISSIRKNREKNQEQNIDDNEH